MGYSNDPKYNESKRHADATGFDPVQKQIGEMSDSLNRQVSNLSHTIETLFENKLDEHYQFLDRQKEENRQKFYRFLEEEMKEFVGNDEDDDDEEEIIMLPKTTRTANDVLVEMQKKEQKEKEEKLEEQTKQRKDLIELNIKALIYTALFIIVFLIIYLIK